MNVRSSWEDRAADDLRRALKVGAKRLGEPELRELLEGTPIRFGEAIRCGSPDDAGTAADGLGYPVVVKGIRDGVLHKTEMGLVTGPLFRRMEVIAAARAMAGAVSFSVQRRLEGVEIALGATRDHLGPFVMVSTGGALIEIADDAAMAMAPVDRVTAERTLRSLRIWPLLNGYRGRPAADIGAIVDLIVGVSRLAVAAPQLSEFDLNPVFASAAGCLAADGAAVLTDPPSVEEREGGGGAALRQILAARRIAVFGGVSRPEQVGSRLLRYLRDHGFTGDVVAIAPEADGEGVYRDLGAIGQPVDMACIAVPAAGVESVVEQCIAAGVPTGVIFSAGFAEMGADGAASQSAIAANAHGRFRFLGPNSYGVVAPHKRMFASFAGALEVEATAGDVAFISQSGAIASALYSRAREYGLGFSRWIAVGNEADIGIADCIEEAVDDAGTRVVCLFLEMIRRPMAFQAACRAAHRSGKPVIAFKTGVSETGRRAAASHTGALSGSDRVYDAFFRNCGVVRVRELSALFAAAQGLLSAGAVAGRRVAVVTMSGGIASLLADSLEADGLELATFPADIQQRLRRILPSYATASNPVDLTVAPIGAPGMIRSVLQIIRNSGAADLMLVQLTTNADPAAARIAAELISERDEPGLPVLIGRLGARVLAPRAMRLYREAGVHVFDWPEQLAQAAAACVTYGHLREDLGGLPTHG